MNANRDGRNRSRRVCHSGTILKWIDRSQRQFFPQDRFWYRRRRVNALGNGKGDGGISETTPVLFSPMQSRKLTIGRMTIELRQTTPRNMAPAGRLSGLLIQAFRALGKEHVTEARIAKLKATLPKSERHKLLKDLAFAPAWMYPHFRNLSESPSEKC